MRTADLKIEQLELAQSLGFEIPPTLITNDPREFLRFYSDNGGRVISKIAHGPSFDASYPEITRYTTAVTRRDLAFAHRIRSCPTLFQANVPKRIEVRVVVVGAGVFAAEIDLQGSHRAAQDWRRYDVANTRHRVHDLPESVREGCRRLVRSLGLMYGAIDLILRPDGKYVFLEVNPGGQYLWVEDLTGLPITDAIVDFLAAAARGRDKKLQVQEKVFDETSPEQPARPCADGASHEPSVISRGNRAVPTGDGAPALPSARAGQGVHRRRLGAAGVVGFLLYVLAASAPTRAAPGGPDEVTAEVRATLKRLQGEAGRARSEKNYTKCASLYGEAARVRPGHGAAAYEAACCAALAGNQDEAADQLLAAIAAGYHDAPWVMKDRDLVPLHGHPRWKAVVDGAQANHARYLRTVNTELYELFKADQADRAPGAKVSAESMVRNDAVRLERVRAIVKSGGLKAGDDYYHAAMIFQHGDGVQDFREANRLALRAAELKHPRARWLAAASKDRELMTAGQPQLYGTQFVRDKTGRWVVYRVDNAITDDERARWDVPPLDEARRRADNMNQTGRP